MRTSGPSLSAISGLSIILFSALLLGANRPWAWTFLLLGSALVLLTTMALSATLRHQMRKAAASVWVQGLCLCGVIIWALIQPQVLEMLQSSSTRAGPVTDFQRSALFTQRLVCYGLVFVLAVAAASDRRVTRNCLLLLSLFSMAMALVAIFSVATGTEVVAALDTQASAGKATGTFVNQNSYVMFAAFGVYANMILLRTTLSDIASSWPNRRRKGRLLLSHVSGTNLFLATSLLAGGVALILTGSRSGMMAAFFGLVTLLWLDRVNAGREGSRRLWLFALPPVAIGVAAIGYQLLVRHYFGSGHDSLRFEIYRQIIVSLGDMGWVGGGLGNFQYAFLPYRSAELSWLTWDYAHNSYLELAVELGVPAALLFFATVGSLVAVIFVKAAKRGFDRSAPRLAIACTVAAAFHALFDFSLQMPANAALYAFLLGLGWGSVHRRSRRTRSDQPTAL